MGIARRDHAAPLGLQASARAAEMFGACRHGTYPIDKFERRQYLFDGKSFPQSLHKFGA